MALSSSCSLFQLLRHVSPQQYCELLLSEVLLLSSFDPTRFSDVQHIHSPNKIFWKKKKGCLWAK